MLTRAKTHAWLEWEQTSIYNRDDGQAGRKAGRQARVVGEAQAMRSKGRVSMYLQDSSRRRLSAWRERRGEGRGEAKGGGKDGCGQGKADQSTVGGVRVE